MLRQLLSSHDNGKSLVIHHLGLQHALSVFIVSWQRSEHGNNSIMYESCSVSCHHLMTTVRALLYIIYLFNMPCKLSSANDNGHNMVMYSSGMKHAPSIFIVSWQRTKHCCSSLRYEHAPSVVIVSRQRSEHGIIYLWYESCSISCHRLMTTVREWLYIIHVWNMLRQLSSSHDNGQSMIIYPLGINHAPSVVIVSWQRSGHGDISLKYESCSVSCRRLMTTSRAWLYIPKVSNKLR